MRQRTEGTSERKQCVVQKGIGKTPSCRVTILHVHDGQMRAGAGRAVEMKRFRGPVKKREGSDEPDAKRARIMTVGVDKMVLGILVSSLDEASAV